MDPRKPDEELAGSPVIIYERARGARDNIREELILSEKSIASF